MAASTIVLLTTGGTVAATTTADGAVPALAAADLVPDLSAPHGEPLPDIAVSPVDLMSVDSSAMTSADRFAIVGAIGAALSDPAVTAVVVTHGTDTMEETAYLADLFHHRLPALWQATLAYAGAGDPDALRAAVAEVEAGELAERRRRLPARLWAALDQVGHDPTDPGHQALAGLLADLRARNLGLLRHLKLVLRRGLLRFERIDAGTVQSTAPHLVRILHSLPSLLAEHGKTTLAAAARHGIA